MMKHGLIILLFLIPVFAFAQYPNNPNKIRLGFQTTGNGLIYRGASAPTLFPTGYNSAFQFYDTIANTLWVYQDSFWYLTNTIRRSTPPPYSSTSSGLTLVYGHGVWQDTDDYHRYEYVANDSIEAWVPATGTYYWPSQPSDIAATGTTGAVKYTAGLWNKVPTDSLFRYDGSAWVFIGADGSVNYLEGDAGTVQVISNGDTIAVIGGYGVNTSAGDTDAVTVTADTSELATPYDVQFIQDSLDSHIALDNDTSDTNELQTLSFSSPDLSISGGNSVSLSSLLTGYPTGSGTAGRVPRWTSTSALSDGVLRDDGSLLAINGVTVTGYSFYDYSTSTWKLPTRTTAQRPTGVIGGFGFNTTLGYGETYNGSAWLQSDFPTGTTRQTLYSNGTSWVASSFLENDNTNKIINIIGSTHRFYISPVAFTDGIAMDASFSFLDNALANGGALAIGSRTLWIRMLGLGAAGRGLLIAGNSNSVTTNANTLLTLNHNSSFNLQEWRQGSKVLGRFSSLTGADALLEVISESTGPTRGLAVRQHNNTAAASIIQFYKSRGTFSAQTVLSNGDAIGAFVFNGYTGSSYLSNVAYFGAGVTGTISASAMPTSIYFAPGSAANNTTPTILAHHTKKVGIGDFGAVGSLTEPARLLEVKGEARITDLTTDPMTQIVGADADGDLSASTPGFGLSVTGGVPQVDTSVIATQSDLSSVSVTTLYTGDGTIATDRTVTVNSGQTLRFAGPAALAPGFDYDFDLGYDDDDFGLDGLSFYGFGDTTQAYIYAGVYSNTSAEWGMGVQHDIDVSSSLIAGDQAGGLTLSGSDGSDAATVTFGTGTAVGYGPRVYGSNGIEFDTGAGGSIVSQINNTTETTLTSTGLGISDTSPERELDVAGMGKFRQISGQDNSPSIGTNANMGTGRSASITGSHSSDVAGRISFTSGTTLTAGEWVTMTWGGTFDNPPAVQLFPENANGASIVPYLFVVPTTTGVSIAVNVTGVPYEGLTFEFNYIVIQGK